MDSSLFYPQEKIKMKSTEYKIYWGPCFLIFFGKNMDTQSHNHHALQISISLKNEIKICCNSTEITGNIILIGADVEHRLVKGELGLLILVDPESDEAYYLKKILHKNDISIVEQEKIASIVQPISSVMTNNILYPEMERLFYNIIEGITGKKTERSILDKRILRVIDFVNGLEQIKAPIGKLTDIACLSESRLQHLFKEQVGIPIRRYLLWRKLLSAFESISRGSDFTSASIEAGFSDSAHFSRTFKKMFGLTLSGEIKDSRFIQVFFQNH